jgi:hypothetical protein
VGQRFAIEYERRIRLTDPLIRSGELFLDGLVQHAGLAWSTYRAHAARQADPSLMSERARRDAELRPEPPIFASSRLHGDVRPANVSLPATTFLRLTVIGMPSHHHRHRRSVR